MVQERSSGGAGVRPAGPTRPQTPSTPAPVAPVRSVPPAPDAVPVVEPPALSGPIPVEELPLDPRVIARASLAAGRNASLWWISAGILVALVVSLVVGTGAGAIVLAGVLAGGAVARWVLPSPGPVALSVRAKAIDVTVLAALAVGLVVLAVLVPGGWG